MESEPMLTPREKIPSTGKILLRGGPKPRRCIKQSSEPNTLPTNYSGPSQLFDNIKDREADFREKTQMSEMQEEKRVCRKTDTRTRNMYYALDQTSSVPPG